MPRTDAQRLAHRDYVRARRSEAKRDAEFAEFCREMRLNPSPPSSLNPDYWRGISLEVENYTVIAKRKDIAGTDAYYHGNKHLFARAA